MNRNEEQSLPDLLLVEGINCKGFGVLPKFVMLDPDLSLEAKAIYAYFCSYAGNGTSAFPGRDIILYHLQIDKNTYYKHYNQLIEQGYISVEQKNTEGGFKKNIYNLISNPKKFQEYKVTEQKTKKYNGIAFSALKSAGFGCIPKALMIDERLPLKAKGVYSYFCSFTGSGNSSFPKREHIFHHLKLAEKTYYKFFNMLKELNYIEVEQRYVDGRLSVNDYYLIDNPSKEKQYGKISDTLENQSFANEKQYGKISDTVEKQYGNFSYTQKQDTQKQDTQISDTNINSTNINSYNKINLSIQASSACIPAKPGEDLMDGEIISVKDDLLDKKELPYWYKENFEKMTEAIHFMTEWDKFFPAGYSDPFEQSIYNLFNEALIEMCCTDQPMKLKGSFVTYAKVIEKINQLAIFESDYVNISSFMETAMNDFKNAAAEKEIKNHLQYMKACIWNAMQAGQIGLYSLLKRDNII